MPRQRYTEQEVEEMMVPRLVEAVYPVLIPIEQQDCRIQAKNHERVTEIARQVWREFVKRPGL